MCYIRFAFKKTVRIDSTQWNRMWYYCHFVFFFLFLLSTVLFHLLPLSIFVSWFCACHAVFYAIVCTKIISFQFQKRLYFSSPYGCHAFHVTWRIWLRSSTLISVLYMRLQRWELNYIETFVMVNIYINCYGWWPFEKSQKDILVPIHPVFVLI